MADDEVKLQRSHPEAPHLTASYINDVLEAQRKRYNERNRIIGELRKLRFMQDTGKDDIPEAFRERQEPVMTYTAGKYVENEVGALTTLPFTVHVPSPPQATFDQVANGDIIERFSPALWRSMEVSRGRDTYRLLFDNMVADGQGVLKQLYRPNAWYDRPTAQTFAAKAFPSSYTEQQALDRLSPAERRAFDQAFDKYAMKTSSEGRLPFMARSVDPTTVFWIEGEWGMDAVIEESTRSLAACTRMAGPFGGLPLSSDDSDLGPTVRVVEYWDHEFMAVAIEIPGRKSGPFAIRDAPNELRMVGVMKHGHRRIPYWRMFGQETSSTDPRYEAISTLYKVRSTVPAFHRALTMWWNIMHSKAYPTFQQKRQPPGPHDATTEPIAKRMKAGNIVYVDDAVDDPFIRAIEWPDTHVDVGMLMQVLLGQSDATQMDDAATGGSRMSGEAGALRAQLVDLARTGYHQIIEHAARELSSAVNWQLEMIDQVIKRKVWVMDNRSRDDNGIKRPNWIGIDQTDVNGYYFAEVRIQPFNPVMNIAQGTYARNMVAGSMLPQRYALEEIMGVSNAVELMEEMIAEEILEDPSVRSAIKLRALRRAGLDDLIPDMQAAEAAQGGMDPAVAAQFGGQVMGNPGMPGAGAPIAGAANQGNAVPTETPGI